MNLDEMICDDGEKCLKWGDHCYAGRISVPEGTTVHMYRGFDACSGDPTTVHSDTDFWNSDDRYCTFKFESAGC